MLHSQPAPRTGSSDDGAGLVAMLEKFRGAPVPTPVVSLEHERVDLYAKLEFATPTGSVKDRSAYWILKRAIERGEVTPGSTVIESSSGNFALAMAWYCRAVGMAFVPVVDPNTNAPTLAQLRALCERVELVTEPDAGGGFLRTRLDRVRRLRDEIPGAYWPNQYTNADAAEAHFRLTGGEVHDRFERLDYAFVGVGTGATIAGLSARLKRAYPRVRVVGVDAVGSAIFGGEPRRRHIPGIGSSIVPPMVARATIDDVVLVPETDAVDGCHTLLRDHGIFAGGSTGSVLSAVERYFADRPLPTRPTVLFLCADAGNAYARTVYATDWVARTLRPEPAAVELPARPA